ncbi:MAG: hypothetical protein JWQ96_1256 [Segetibacter sp.]|nr:hypothetical protein [Segetibacter sp.]
MRKLLSLLSIPLLLYSCTPESADYNGTVEGYAPVYVSSATASTISVEPARAITKAGKIYVHGTYLFENDVNKGIHIIDVSDRARPRKVAFINVPLSTEVAVKGNYLYTNNLDDLLTFDISNPTAPVLVKRIDDVFPMPNQNYPPFTGVSFECADPSKGVVVQWEPKRIKNAKCRR